MLKPNFLQDFYIAPLDYLLHSRVRPANITIGYRSLGAEALKPVNMEASEIATQILPAGL